MRRAAFFAAAFAVTLIAITPSPHAQAPPSTDIFLANIKKKGSRLVISAPVNITARDGYDNQPSFERSGRTILFTSIRSNNQADIYRYDIENGTTTQVTGTKESEYSPTVTPDGGFISVIRVEADSTQRLWKFPLAGGEPVLVLENVKPVGYHVWAGEGAVVVFVLGNPNTLQLADLNTGKGEIIAQNVGRSLHAIPGTRRISFVHKVSATEWLIKSFDPKTKAIAEIAPVVQGSEDYAWLPDGSLLMGKDSKLFRCDRRCREGWTEVADLSYAGLKGITRLAVNPKGDRIAVVAISAK